jgi:hypothetical protein
MGRRRRQMGRTNACGFPLKAAKATSVVGGSRTGDLVRAVVPASSVKAGVYGGRIAVRATGSCNIKTARETIEGIPVRYCQPLQRGDGYAYTKGAALAPTAEDVSAAARAIITLGEAIPQGIEGDWTPTEILGHVCVGSRVWGGRMRHVAREEEPALESFDEGMALRVPGYRWKHLEPLLAECRIVSDDTLAFLRRLAPQGWTCLGRCPALGRVSLGDLARIAMEHKRDHARQLREAISETVVETIAREHLE